MRISVLPDDPGYAVHPACDVYLDGVKIHNCYTADDERGEVVVLDTDVAINDIGSLPTKVLRGAVRIEPIVDRWYFR